MSPVKFSEFLKNNQRGPNPFLGTTNLTQNRIFHAKHRNTTELSIRLGYRY